MANIIVIFLLLLLILLLHFSNGNHNRKEEWNYVEIHRYRKEVGEILKNEELTSLLLNSLLMVEDFLQITGLEATKSTILFNSPALEVGSQYISHLPNVLPSFQDNHKSRQFNLFNRFVYLKKCS